MNTFRAYLIDENDQIVKRIDLACGSEAEAMEHARQLVDGHAVELWDGPNKIAEFKQTSTQPH